jgi:hypothetical protein
MAVLKLRKYISKHTLNDTINFWSNDPGKTPVWGKPVRERTPSYFFKFWKLHQQK